MSVSKYIFKNHQILLKKPKVSDIRQPVRYSSSENVIENDAWKNAKPFSSMPGPKPAPIIGNLWRFLPLIGTFWGIEYHNFPKTLNEKYGQIVKITDIKLQNDMIFIFNPDDVETIFRNDGPSPKRDVLPSLMHFRETRKEKFGGFKGIFSLDGKEWLEARSIINPILMQPKVVKAHTKPVNDVTQDFIEKIKTLSEQSDVNEMPEDFEKYINYWTLENITHMGLDIRLGLLKNKISPKDERFMKANLEIFDLLFELDMKPNLWKYISTPTYRKCIKHMDVMVDYVIEKCDLALSKMDNNKPVEDMTIFERFLKIDRHIAIGTVMDMLFAGVDTTSRVASSLLYHLARNVEVQEKLRAEIMEKVPTPDMPITSELLETLPYMRAVIKESMRISPVGLGIQRHLQKDLVLSGYRVPKGVNVALCSLDLCMKDEYFPDAKKFIPERWLRDNNVRKVEINPFVYYPFGFGPRICIGKRLATLELEIFLVKVIRNFKMEWHHGEAEFKAKILYGITSPLKLTMIPIEN